MGQIISLEGWKAGHRVAAPTPTAEPDMDRLERAVERLDAILLIVGTHPAGSGIDVETELLAIKGAMSLRDFDQAACRAEALAGRLSSRRAGKG